MIIDIHTHCFPEKIAAHAIGLLHEASGYPYFHDGTAAGLSRSTREAGIDLSVIQPVATRPGQTQPANRWADTIRGGALTSFGTIHPEYDGWKSEIQWLKEMDFKGIKMHPEYQGGFFVDDERFFPIYEAAFDAGLIIIFHAGGDIAYPPPYHCEPAQLSKMMSHFPGGVVIAAHMGGYQFWDEVEEHLLGKPVYIDTSFSIDQLGTARATRMIRQHGAGRVLFGTDAPWKDQSASLAEVRRLDLTPDEQSAVLGGNAARLLGIWANKEGKFMDMQEPSESTYISPLTGAKLRKARVDRSLTQSELAGRINATQTQIENYERGGLDMPVARLFDIAAILEMNVADLLAE